MNEREEGHPAFRAFVENPHERPAPVRLRGSGAAELLLWRSARSSPPAKALRTVASRLLLQRQMTHLTSEARRVSARKAASLPILVLSDRPLFRDCIVAFLKVHGFPRTTGDGLRSMPGPSGAKAARLVLVDLGDAEEEPRKVIHALRDLAPTSTVVAVGSPIQIAAQAAEADGWLKPSDTGAQLSALVGDVERSASGRIHFAPSSEIKRLMSTWSHLTARQRQVLALLGCGIDNHKLAEALGLSQRAVKMHVSSLLDKFKADGRAELAVIACRAGLHGPQELDSYRS